LSILDTLLSSWLAIAFSVVLGIRPGSCTY
jgi:hypothetical protein